MLENIRKKRNPKPEEGFTLLELIIVVIAIGILAAIAVPVFLNQQKSALDATIQSDLRNALIAMQTEATKTKGKYPSFLPLSAAASKGNTVVLIDDADNTVTDSKLTSGPTAWNNTTRILPPETGSTPPPSGSSVILQGRDHMMNSNKITVKPGDKIEITITARQLAGTLTLQAGIWVYDGIPSGCAPYLIYPTITNTDPVSTYPNGWATYRHTITVPTEYRNSAVVCPDTQIPPSIGVAPFFQIGQEWTTGIPAGTNKWEVSNIIYRNLSDLSASGNAGYVTSNDGSTIRILQQVCIEGYNEGDPNNVWSITNIDGVPKEGHC